MDIKKIKEVIEIIKKKKYKAYLVGGSSRDFLLQRNFYDVDIACLSLKPFTYKYRYILNKYKYKNYEVAAIGDQLLTDIQGGNKAQITTILVNPISEIDEKETWLNRKIEKMLFEYFERKNILIRGKYYD